MVVKTQGLGENAFDITIAFQVRYIAKCEKGTIVRE